MKPWLKILFIGLLVFALISVSFHILLILKGKSIIVQRLEDLTQRKVTIKYLDWGPYLNFKIRGLDIQGLTKIDTVFVSPSILGLFTGNIAFNDVRMIKPEFTYEKISPRIDASLKIATSDPVTDTEPKRMRRLRFVLKRMDIKDGTLNFIDRTVGKDGIMITVKDLYFHLDNILLVPKSAVTNFELKGKIPWRRLDRQGEISANGWINLFKKDMQAHVEIKDIDGVYLYPYYAKWMDLEKSRIQQANLQFNSDITGLDNNLVAACRLELTDIIFRSKEEGESEQKAHKIATAVLDIFRALDKGKIGLNFTIRTKMDAPEFGFSDIHMAFEEKLAQGAKSDRTTSQDLMKLPVDLVNGAIKGATDITKALIESTVEVGKEIGRLGKKIKDAAIEPFKKEKKE